MTELLLKRINDQLQDGIEIVNDCGYPAEYRIGYLSGLLTNLISDFQELEKRVN